MRGLHPIFPRNASVSVALPEPNADERAHSERLAALIREEIAGAGGALDFARYMELALYAPGLGYYSAGATKFGAAGDFVTAPELGFVFARCLARALAPTLRETRGDVLELGPGSGVLAAELLLELERLDALPMCYRLLERSADLRERQRATLRQRVPHLQHLATWLDAPPAEPWRGVLVANEVIDALPVRLFTLRDAGLFARGVAVDENNGLVWREIRADTALADAYARAVGTRALPRPYASEICTLLAPWFTQVAGSLQQGEAWFIDYGYDRDSYYAPARFEGTLRCHYRHRAHNDPLILPGLQDITAWVDFDALIEAGTNAGFDCLGNVAQSRFLIEHGLDEVFAIARDHAADESARYRLAQEVKRLTLPGQMGEAFRAVCLRRRNEGTAAAD
jgi:SAM-dependent MidA family methyltransferase